MRFISTPTDRSFRSVLTLLSGTVAAQVITLATMPLLTRMFSPEAFGYAAAIAAIGAYLGLGSTLRLESAVYSVAGRWRVERVIAAAMYVNLMIGVLAMAAIATAMLTPLGDLMTDPVGPLFIPLIMVGYGGWAVLRAWAIRDGAFSGVSAASVRRAWVYAATRLLAGAAGTGSIGLLIAEALQYLAGARRLFRGTSLAALATRIARTPKHLRTTLHRYRRFWQRELPSQLLDGGGAAMLIPSFAIVFGPAAAGQFSIADRILSLPVSQISNAMGDVFVREMGTAIRIGDPLEAQRLFARYAVRLTLIGLPVFAGAAAVSPFLLGYVLGESWWDAGYIVALLAPSTLAGFIVAPLSRCAVVMRRQELIGIYGVANLVLTIAAFAIASAASVRYLSGAALVSAARCIAFGLYFVLLRRMMRSLDLGISGG